MDFLALDRFGNLGMVIVVTGEPEYLGLSVGEQLRDHRCRPLETTTFRENGIIFVEICAGTEAAYAQKR